MSAAAATADADAATTTYPRHIANVPYDAASRLNTLDICLPRPLDQSPADAVWVVYIHGGAYRDPLITSTSFTPTLTHLLRHPSHASRVAATASLNYRLSPYPSHATHPSDPVDPARNARHPDHLRDVRAALRWLEKSYGVGVERGYVLVGHSCGGTLGAQVVFGGVGVGGLGLEGGEGEREGEGEVKQPLALVSVAGIYDLAALVHRHGDVSAYHEFVSAAFGPEEKAWEDASPVALVKATARAKGRADASAQSGTSKTSERKAGKQAPTPPSLILLAHSPADELVEPAQRDDMASRLKAVGWDEGDAGRANKRELLLLELEGRHDELWERGEEVARAVGVGLGRV